MLSAPTFVMWSLSTVLAVAAVAAKYFGLAGVVPQVGGLIDAYLWETLLAAYVALWCGTVFRGL